MCLSTSGSTDYECNAVQGRGSEGGWWCRHWHLRGNLFPYSYSSLLRLSYSPPPPALLLYLHPLPTHRLHCTAPACAGAARGARGWEVEQQQSGIARAVQSGTAAASVPLRSALPLLPGCAAWRPPVPTWRPAGPWDRKLTQCGEERRGERQRWESWDSREIQGVEGCGRWRDREKGLRWDKLGRKKILVYQVCGMSYLIWPLNSFLSNSSQCSDRASLGGTSDKLMALTPTWPLSCLLLEWIE